jgi:hypothetical protein
MGSLEAAQASILARTKPGQGTLRIPLRPAVDIVTIALAIASIAFAYLQKVDSAKLKSDTKLLMGSATTGYVAEFPYSIPVITKIVQGACGELSVMADVPGYGQYSAPEAFYWYMHAFLDLRHRTIKNNFDAGRCVGKTLGHGNDLTQAPTIRLLLFTPEDREASLRRQLSPESLVRDLNDPKDPAARNKFMTFFNDNPEMLQEKPEEFLKTVQAGNGYEEFVRVLLDNHKEHEQALKKAGIQIRYARQPFIMRVWIQDAEQAAFSFDHSSETEIAFQARDAKLLDNFKQIFQQQWGSGVCYTDYWNARETNPKINMASMKDCE